MWSFSAATLGRHKKESSTRTYPGVLVILLLFDLLFQLFLPCLNSSSFLLQGLQKLIFALAIMNIVTLFRKRWVPRGGCGRGVTMTAAACCC